jgi:hypothetical protein
MIGDPIPEIPDDLELDESRIPSPSRNDRVDVPPGPSYSAQSVQDAPIGFEPSDVAPILSSILTELQAISSMLREMRT